MADRRKYQRRMFSRFIQVFLTTFVLLMLVVGIGTFVYAVVAQRNVNTPIQSENYSDTDYENALDGRDGEESVFGDKKMTTFAVFGVDKDQYRTDVTMLVFFNHETAKVDIISVPRDTRVKIPDEIYETIQARRSDVNQIVKINEVPAYVVEDRNEVSVAVLEKSLGVDIDYYINMNLDAFKKIVDIIGEVTVEIPFDMEYNDPVQDLYISLKAGTQHLNGAQAEQLIRFRSGYGNGDLGRIEMQHEFMAAFLEQLLSTRNRLNMVNIAGEVLLNVQTNFERSVDYLVFLDDLDPTNFEMHMLPGEADTTTRSYYIYDYDATALLLNEIINEPYTATTESDLEDQGGDETVEPTTAAPVVDVQPAEIVDVKSLTISVQNGTQIGGFAGRTKDTLVAEGYNVVDASDFDEKPVARTRLIVPDIEVYETLKTYFKDPEMILAPAMMEDEFQIVVVLGQDDGEN